MARRATVINQERKTNQNILLVLDAGSALSGQWLSFKTQGQIIVEAMNLMGYDALTIGRMDLALGLETAKKLEAAAKFPFLSANLVSLADKQPIFKPYVILERGGRRLGIIGLSEATAIQAPGVAEKATVLDAIETARKMVAEVRPKVDVLIILSHLGKAMDQKLAQAVPGIDIIVGGETRELMNEPLRVGNTLIVQQGYSGEWLGRLKATFDAQGVPSAYSEEIIALTPDFADDPEMAALVNKYAQLYPTPTPAPTWTPTSKALTPTK